MLSQTAVILLAIENTHVKMRLAGPFVNVGYGEAGPTRTE